MKVIVNTTQAGTLTEENGEYVFTYSASRNDDFISLTMPVRAKSYLNDQLHPIFEMHLPEGYLLSIIKKHFAKLVRSDDFGLLSIMAPNVKARVHFDDNNPPADAYELDALLHSDNDNLFNELVTKFALRSSLSGVQPKVLAAIDDKATLSTQDYIVKSWGDDYPHLAMNEYFCMQVVKRAGVPVAPFYLSDDRKLFIMKRFDIKDDNTNYLGFEDMCVLQAKQRDDKYNGTYEQIAKTIKTFVTPKLRYKALTQFFKMIVINHLVQNGDAHLKNFALLYDTVDHIDLAPAYDVVSTTVYIKNDIPALNLLGSKKWWSKKYILKFGVESCELRPAESASLYRECVAAVESVLIDMQITLATLTTDEKEMLETMIKLFQENVNASESDTES
jgi:serine/threonine-protein kinase HipA